MVNLKFNIISFVRNANYYDSQDISLTVDIIMKNNKTKIELRGPQREVLKAMVELGIIEAPTVNESLSLDLLT